MLQQTPVARVIPAHLAWLARWPTPAALAAEPPGRGDQAVGPARLSAAGAAAARDREDPDRAARRGRSRPSYEALLALPGSAATRPPPWPASRSASGTPCWTPMSGGCWPGWSPGSRSRPSRLGGRAAAGRSLLPDRARGRGALVGGGDGAGRAGVHGRPARAAPTARWRRHCAWLAAGRPRDARRGGGRSSYEGTDRQCRGRLIAVLRESGAPVRRAASTPSGPSPAQLDRALDGLVADGLVDPLPDGRFALPGPAQRRAYAGDELAQRASAGGGPGPAAACGAGFHGAVRRRNPGSGASPG